MVGQGNGICQTNGIGSLVRNFAIGSNQALWGGTGTSTVGASYYDDGINPNATVGFNQSAAFTCHIVAAKVVQCVLGSDIHVPIKRRDADYRPVAIRFDICRVWRPYNRNVAYQCNDGLRRRPELPNHDSWVRSDGEKIHSYGSLYYRSIGSLYLIDGHNLDEFCRHGQSSALRDYGWFGIEWIACHDQQFLAFSDEHGAPRGWGNGCFAHSVHREWGNDHKRPGRLWTRYAYDQQRVWCARCLRH